MNRIKYLLAAACCAAIAAAHAHYIPWQRFADVGSTGTTSTPSLHLAIPMMVLLIVIVGGIFVGPYALVSVLFCKIGKVKPLKSSVCGAVIGCILCAQFEPYSRGVTTCVVLFVFLAALLGSVFAAITEKTI
jgi:hypothetical protein